MAALPQFRFSVTEHGAHPHHRGSGESPRGHATMAWVSPDDKNAPGVVTELVRNGVALNGRGAELLRMYRERM